MEIFLLLFFILVLAIFCIVKYKTSIANYFKRQVRNTRKASYYWIIFKIIYLLYFICVL